ncbi:MAG: polysaccharide deacetylase family protein [Candidatus Bathyarchaeia archaeon]
MKGEGKLKNKGTIILAVTLTLIVGGFVAIDYDNTFLSILFAPAVPNQIYSPNMPSADQKVVCIVFDDGWKSQLDALPVLQSFGFNATFAIVTSYTSYPDYVTWKDIAKLWHSGMDIASHSVTHPDLSIVSSSQLDDELAQIQHALRSRGYPANIFVYPYGSAASNQTVQNAVAKYYLAARGTDVGKCNLDNCDRYNLQSYDVYHDVSMEDFTGYVNGTGGNVVTILYYHKIGNQNEDTAITLQTFQAQMQYLKDNGYTTETLSQLFLKTTP